MKFTGICGRERAMNVNGARLRTRFWVGRRKSIRESISIEQRLPYHERTLHSIVLVAAPMVYALERDAALSLRPTVQRRRCVARTGGLREAL